MERIARTSDDAAEEQVRIGHEMGLRMREDFFPNSIASRMRYPSTMS